MDTAAGLQVCRVLFCSCSGSDKDASSNCGAVGLLGRAPVEDMHLPFIFMDNLFY
jgi:hypothetical protein